MNRHMLADAFSVLRASPDWIDPATHRWVESVLKDTHAVVGIACILVSGVLLIDRAAATRAMFDNRVAFGAMVGLCGLSHFAAVDGLPLMFRVMEAIVMLATSVVSIVVAWMTVSAFLVKRAATT